MKFFKWAQDGGPDSPVRGFFLVEIKRLFSIAILHFPAGQTREAFHSHAFNALTWVLKGAMTEQQLWFKKVIEKVFRPSLKPKFTSRDNVHRVVSPSGMWALTIRGPWAKTWHEVKNGNVITLTHGRKVVEG